MGKWDDLFMILIKKRNDYYDYLVNVYGRDEKKVFNRRNDLSSEDMYFDGASTIDEYMKSSKRKKYLNWLHNTYNIYIANRKYQVQQVAKGEWQFRMFHKKNIKYLGGRDTKLEIDIPDNKKDEYTYFVESDFNKKARKPMSIEGANIRGYADLSDITPILKSFGFSKVLEPTEVYSEIDMFLGWLIDNPCPIKEPDDIVKIEAKGFDKKTSFRHR